MDIFNAQDGSRHTSSRPAASTSSGGFTQQARPSFACSTGRVAQNPAVGPMTTCAWREHPGTDWGTALSLTQTVDGASSGGANALLSRAALEGLAANDPGEADDNDDLKARRLEVKLRYGLPAFGGRLTLTPEAGAGFPDTGRDYRLGRRLTPAVDAGSFELSLEAARREATNNNGTDAAAYEAGLRLTTQW